MSGDLKDLLMTQYFELNAWIVSKIYFFSWAMKISESSWLGNFPRYSFEFFTRGQCLNPEQRDKRPGSMWIDLRSRSTQYENFIDNLL